MDFARKTMNAKNIFLSLILNNIDVKKVKKIKLTLNESKTKKYIKVLMDDGTLKMVPYSQYKLNKKAAISVSLTAVIGTAAIVGTIASFKYSKNNDDIKLYKYDNQNTYIEETENETDVTYPSASVNESNNILSTEPSIEPVIAETTTATTLDEEPIVSETINEEEIVESIDESQIITYDDVVNDNYDENNTIRYINIAGDSTRDVSIHDYIINTYYNDILEFGITYGIDPSIIASIIMQEGSNMYNPNNEENYSAIGLGQLNGNIWNGVSFNVYNFTTKSYETYKINTEILSNNPREQIKVITIMLQDSAIRYSGNLNAMLVCYNQGMTTVSNITSQIVSSGSYSSSQDVYNSSDPLVISNSNNYTYGDQAYTEKICTFMDYCLTYEDFGRDCASITLPSGEVYTYYVSTDLNISR